MIADREKSARRVLCVIPADEGQHHGVVQAVRDAGAEVVLVDDAYRAMALVSREGSAGWGAALVAVDRLDGSELEFFELVARHHRELPVYAFAASDTSVSLTSSVERGARGIVDVRSVAESLGPILAPPAPAESEALDAKADGPAIRNLDPRSEGPGPPPTPTIEPTVEAEHEIDVALDQRLATLTAREPDKGKEKPDEQVRGPVETSAPVAEPAVKPEEAVAKDRPRSGDVRSRVSVPWRPSPDRPRRVPPGVAPTKTPREEASRPSGVTDTGASPVSSELPLRDSAGAIESGLSGSRSERLLDDTSPPGPMTETPSSDARADEPAAGPEPPLLTPEELDALMADEPLPGAPGSEVEDEPS